MSFYNSFSSFLCCFISFPQSPIVACVSLFLSFFSNLWSFIFCHQKLILEVHRHLYIIFLRFIFDIAAQNNVACKYSKRFPLEKYVNYQLTALAFSFFNKRVVQGLQFSSFGFKTENNVITIASLNVRGLGNDSKRRETFN